MMLVDDDLRFWFLLRERDLFGDLIFFGFSAVWGALGLFNCKCGQMPPVPKFYFSRAKPRPRYMKINRPLVGSYTLPCTQDKAKF